MTDSEVVAGTKTVNSGDVSDVVEPVIDLLPTVEDDDFHEDDWNRPRRTNKLTSALLITLLCVAGFAGGVEVQRRWGSATSSATGQRGAPGNGATEAGVFGPGALGGGNPMGGGQDSTRASGSRAQAGAVAGAPAGAQGGAPASGGTAGQGLKQGSGAATTSTPIVVGTVTAIKGTTVSVRNFAGTTAAVTVNATTAVTSQGLDGLTVGSAVAVYGTRAANESIAATAVVAQVKK